MKCLLITWNLLVQSSYSPWPPGIKSGASLSVFLPQCVASRTELTSTSLADLSVFSFPLVLWLTSSNQAVELHVRIVATSRFVFVNRGVDLVEFFFIRVWSMRNLLSHDSAIRISLNLISSCVLLLLNSNIHNAVQF